MENEPTNMVTKILELSRQDPSRLKELEKFRRSVAVLFTDIQGSTAYYEKFGDIAGFAMVHECNDLLKKIVEEHGGRVIKNIGDAIMACFDSCEQSVKATVEMQRKLREANSSKIEEEQQARVRIGVHYGQAIVRAGDVFGDAVNVASRIQSLALPEQILISDCLAREVATCDFDMSPLGRFQLKGKTEERELYEVRWTRKIPTRANLAHTIITSPTSAPQEFTIQHLNRGGKVDAEYPLFGEGITIGRNEGDLKFSDDTAMYSPHAHIFVHRGQPLVEDLSHKGGIFIRLKGVFTLENHDIIVMGGQLFKFESKPEIMAAAAAMARTVPDVSRVLNENPAEFVRLNPDALGQQKAFPLGKEEIRFGRTTGDYTFPQDRLMSRAHARVYLRGEDYFLEDLGTLNGTFAKIRGKTPVPLGASVRVGREVFVIV